MTTAVLKRALFDHLLHRCYVKLAPSRIAGVGVRAVCDIPPDTDPFVSPNAQLQPPKLTHTPRGLRTVRPGASVLYVRDTHIGLLRVVRTIGTGKLALRRHALYVRRTRTSLGRAVRTAYRGTTGSRPSRRASLCARTS